MLLFSFRGDFLLYMAIIIGWYYYTSFLSSRKHFIACCWAFMLLVLYLNEQFDHFRMVSSFIEQYIPIDWLKNSSRQVHCSQLLNMTFLKLLSYSIDKKKGSERKELEKHREKCNMCRDE